MKWKLTNSAREGESKWNYDPIIQTTLQMQLPENNRSREMKEKWRDLRVESEWLRKLTPPFYTQPVMFLGFSLSGFDLNLIRMDWAKI